MGVGAWGGCKLVACRWFQECIVHSGVLNLGVGASGAARWTRAEVCWIRTEVCRICDQACATPPLKGVGDATPPLKGVGGATPPLKCEPRNQVVAEAKKPITDLLISPPYVGPWFWGYRLARAHQRHAVRLRDERESFVLTTYWSETT